MPPAPPVADNDNISAAINEYVPEELRGTDRFLDIINWNIRYFNELDPSRVRLITKIMSEINGDIFVLQEIAEGAVNQVANALKTEGYSFTVFTPGDGLRLAADRGRDDFIEFALDTSGERPQVSGRISHARGSRTIDEERPVNPGAGPEALTEDDVLEFLMHALEPWLER